MVNVIVNNQHTGTKITILKQSINFFLISIMTATAYAGEVVEVISKDLTSSENAEETLKFLFSDGFMKMSTDQENDVIFNSQSRNMMIISHAEKSYMIFDENTASNIKSEIDKAMEEALAQVPPEQRAMVERMMKQQMGNMNGGAPQMQMEMPKAEIRKVGRSDTINGISCEYYEAYTGNEKDMELCVADWDDIDASENMRNSFMAMGEMMEGFLEQISQMAPMMQSNDNPFAYLKEMDGYPILSRQFSNGVATEETVLKSITEQDIEKNEFNAPEGYNKQDMMGM